MGGVSPALQGLKDYDMTTLLHTHEGAVPMHTVIEEQMQQEEKDIRWEALREQVNTIGARDALNLAVAKLEGGAL